MKKYKVNQDLSKKAKTLALVGDKARIRILCMMFDRQETCVSDVAKALGMSVAAVSHHLQLMKKEGLLKTCRKKNNICYSVVKDKYTTQLHKFVCLI